MTRPMVVEINSPLTVPVRTKAMPTLPQVMTTMTRAHIITDQGMEPTAPPAPQGTTTTMMIEKGRTTMMTVT